MKSSNESFKDQGERESVRAEKRDRDAEREREREREREEREKRRFGVNAMISLIEAGLCACELQ